MSKLASIVIVTMLGGGAVACLVPSFEGMSSGGTADSSRDEPSPDASRGTASDAASEASSNPDVSSGGSALDGGLDAGPRTFQCNPDKGSERCLLGSQACCYNYNAGPTWKCVAHNGPDFCFGRGTCADNSDCPSGETCCFDVTQGACFKGGCPSTGYQICDRTKSDLVTCGNGLKCTYPHFNYEPPRCK